MCENCKDRLVELAGSGIYSACKIGNAVDIHRWSRSVLGPKVEPPEELHCTVAYSKKSFDVTRVPDFKPIKLGKNKGRRIGRLGDMIVLFLDEDEARPLKKIWKAFIDQGASWDFPSYVCHISLAKESKLSDADLAELTPYSGPILFLPPYIDALGDEEFEYDDEAHKETAAKVVTKKEVIKKIKALIVKFENARSDATADKYRAQIYEELEKHQIEREEVGLKPLKGAKAKKEPAGLPKLTENEKKMLVSVFNCHYGNNGDEIWAWAHNDSMKPHNLAKVTASGVIASLVKKKLMHSLDDGKDSTCGLTSKGQEVAEKLDKVMGEDNPIMPKPVPKVKKPVTKPIPKAVTSDRTSMILEIKSWIKKWERTSSDTTADKLQKQIYEAMEKYNITRAEVGLPEKKEKPSTKKSVEKTPLTKSTMPLKRIPLMPLARAQAGSNQVKVSYLKELWNILNDEKFAGQMKMPNIQISKAVKVERFRRRGVWVASTRRLAINPHLFNNEAALYEVFLHEMCHQAVHEITKLGYREERGGHGPVWASWMVKVGLDPKRFDENENADYMTEQEKKDYLEKKEKREKAVESEKRLTYPQTGTPVKFLDSKTNTWRHGLIGLPNDQAGKRWGFIDDQSTVNRWTVVPVSMMYQVNEIDGAALKTRYANKLRDITASQQEVKDIRAEKRARRKEVRNMFGGYF